jgi:ATP-dependent DNA helicase RecG
VTELSDILDSIEKRLRLEMETHYQDGASAGRRLDGYAAYWCERAGQAAEDDSLHAPLAELAQTFEGYRTAGLAERAAAVEKGLALVDKLRSLERERLSALLAELDQPHESRGPAGGRRRWVDRMQALGVRTRKDFLYYFPRDYVPLKAVEQLQEGERACILATVLRRHVTNIGSRGPMLRKRYSLEVEDESGRVTVTSFAQMRRSAAAQEKFSPLAMHYEPGARLLIDGSVKGHGPFIEMIYQDVQPAAGLDFLKPGQLVPVYPLTERVYQSHLRPAIRGLLERYSAALPDPLPSQMRRQHGLVTLQAALPQIHWPDSQRSLERARRRLAFEELLYLQLALAVRREEVKRSGGFVMKGIARVLDSLRPLLEYDFTAAQARVISEIAHDMQAGRVMSRLLQGDVGSGKTVVALAAMLLAVESGFQAALMAPTEILAAQHYLVLSHLARPLGREIGLLIGAMTQREKQRERERIASGEAHIVVGTHALLEEPVAFKNLGLVVVDEQHRFGVLQRARLLQKGLNPHVLVMTATPIPRTLALTVYGDLDVSALDEMPPGRQPIETRWFPTPKLQEAYAFVRRQVEQGYQAYILCPLIEESEKLQAQAATQLAEELRSDVFPDLRVGLLHGRLKTAEKDRAMEAFRLGHIDILATTTVIEVGVDVPNACVMLILNAERFGLSQLHQLRGRVGRGAAKSYCILAADARYDPRFSSLDQDDTSGQGRARIRALLKENDGFAISEEDLRLRGPGEFYGTRQHGIADLRVADLLKDQPLLEEAREAAFRLVAQDPALSSPPHALLGDQVRRIRQAMDTAPP